MSVCLLNTCLSCQLVYRSVWLPFCSCKSLSVSLSMLVSEWVSVYMCAWSPLSVLVSLCKPCYQYSFSHCIMRLPPTNETLDCKYPHYRTYCMIVNMQLIWGAHPRISRSMDPLRFQTPEMTTGIVIVVERMVFRRELFDSRAVKYTSKCHPLRIADPIITIIGIISPERLPCNVKSAYSILKQCSYISHQIFWLFIFNSLPFFLCYLLT